MEIETDNGEIKRKRKRKGKKKSKKERLTSRAVLDPETSNVTTGLSNHPINTLSQLKLLLVSNFPNENPSKQWDIAQNLVLQLNTWEAKRILIESILFDFQQPKAAAHYTKRLCVQVKDLIQLLQQKIQQEELLSTIAKYLVALGPDFIPDKLVFKTFVMPWLAQEELSVIQILLHDNDQLKRLLVEECLKTGEGLHLVNQYASGYVPEINNSIQKMKTKTHIANNSSACSTDVLVDESAREVVCHRVEGILQLLWPDARVHMFGSSSTGLCESQDDIDMCVFLPTVPKFLQETADIVEEIADHLGVYLETGVDQAIVAVKDARIPLVKFHDPRTGLQCDLCVNNIAALWNTELLKWYLKDPKVFSLAKAVKKWFKQRKLSFSTSSHTLSSYAALLLIIYYYQRRLQLPSIDAFSIYRQKEEDLEFVTPDSIRLQLEEIVEKPQGDIRNAISSSFEYDLLDFFRFYTFEFDAIETVVSLRDVHTTKDQKNWSTSNKKKKGSATVIWSIEDPIELDRDLGKYLTRKTMKTLRFELLRACILLTKDSKTSYFYDIVCREKVIADQNHVLAGDEDFAVGLKTIKDGIRLVNQSLELEKIQLGNTIAVDCEGHRLGQWTPSMTASKSHLTLVQIAYQDQITGSISVVLIDLMSSQRAVLLEQLSKIMQDDKIEKIFHDCRADTIALRNEGIQLQGVVTDTQVLHRVLTSLTKLCSTGRETTKIEDDAQFEALADNESQNVKKRKRPQARWGGAWCVGGICHDTASLSSLLKTHLGIELSEKNLMKQEMESDETKGLWAKRPLDEAMITYAAGDVLYLFALREMLLKKLQMTVYRRDLTTILSWDELQIQMKQQIDAYVGIADFFSSKAAKWWTQTSKSLEVGMELYAVISNVKSSASYFCQLLVDTPEKKCPTGVLRLNAETEARLFCIGQLIKVRVQKIEIKTAQQIHYFLQTSEEVKRCEVSRNSLL